jgi:hypothetical protein
MKQERIAEWLETIGVGFVTTINGYLVYRVTNEYWIADLTVISVYGKGKTLEEATDHIYNRK